MALKTIMTRPVVTVEMDDDLQKIKTIFDSTNFHHLFVVEDQILRGVISDRDLLKSLSPNLGTAAETAKDLACLQKKAHQIMTRKPIALEQEASVYAAIEIFNTHRISCIPIVNTAFTPVGVVSWRDVMQAIGTQWQKQAHEKASR